MDQTNNTKEDMIGKAKEWMNCFKAKCGRECKLNLPCPHGYSANFDMLKFVEFAIKYMEEH